jgi:ABC-type transport system involved in multi-copper enzyme maturation permease subunit
VVGAILIFVHYVVSYLFSGMTVYLIYGYLSEGDGRMDKAFAKVQREFWNIISLAAVSTVVNMFTNRLRNTRSRRGGANLVGGALGGLIETVWTEASYLILPAMMIEDANLATGIKRATQIAKGNLLLIGVSTVGVRWITGFISFVLGAIGLVFGLGVGFGLISLFNSSTIALIIGIGLGAMIFFVFVMVASLISSYTMTAYNTCLFLWARDVEKAQAQGNPIQVVAPAPLAAALV